MPNWVYSVIYTTKDKEEFVKKVIEAGGLCNHYLPMPEEIRNTNSPLSIISDEEYAKRELEGTTTDTPHPRITRHYMTQSMADMLRVKYRADNWYDWAYMYWNTKWGDCDMQYEIDGDTLRVRYKSAWSPIGAHIVEKFVTDLGGEVEYEWEEEQGFGMIVNYNDGEFVDMHEWDMPEFKHQVFMDSDIPSSFGDGKFVQNSYVYLDYDYEGRMGTYEKGWHDEGEWYSESSLITDEDLINLLESKKNEEEADEEFHADSDGSAQEGLPF